MTHYFFCGIGGSGMSALAQAVRAAGHAVSGSDRAYDNGESLEKFSKLKGLGMDLYPQDGSGVIESVADVLVVSSAVEDSIPDVASAKKLGLKIQKRAELLAELVNNSRGICVGGTSGKSTVTGMIGHILSICGYSPTVINGGVMLNVKDGLGNCQMGHEDITVIEADESDGSIDFYTPEIAIINNITLDHKPLSELRPLFKDFAHKAKKGVVLNSDCPESIQLKDVGNKTVTFSLVDGKADFYGHDIVALPGGIAFQVNGQKARLQVPGKHNVSNALSALATTSLLGVELRHAISALSTFAGIHRRLEVVGMQEGVTVIDDFAHNPDKIEASLNTLQEYSGRLLVMFQPHGFGPTKFLKDGLIQAFSEGLKDEDILYMPEIFYAGGSAEKSISAKDLIDAISLRGKNATFFEKRDDIFEEILKEVKEGDRVVIMGARDDSLTALAQKILTSIDVQEMNGS